MCRRSLRAAEFLIAYRANHRAERSVGAPRRSAAWLLAPLALVLFAANSARARDANEQPPVIEAAAAPSGPISFLQSEMIQEQIPGLQVAVVKHAKLIALGAFGLADIQHNVPVTNDTVFAINSCTKAFTGVALMQLVDEGKLDLDAPVSRYLEDMPMAWRGVTIRQMATNMSGLPEHWLETHLLVTGDFEKTWAKARTLPMVFRPGERVQYNQTNWLLLGWVIEKLSGKTFEQFVTDRQFNVVGMPRTAQTGWADDLSILQNDARVYSNIRNVHKSGDWGTWPGQDFIVNTHQLTNTGGIVFPTAHKPSSGLESTAQEIARWLVALQEGKLLSKASLKEMWTAGVLNNGTRGMWGIGWPVYSRREHSVVLPSGGARSAFAVYPDDELAVVVLTNLLGSWPERFIDEVAAYYVGDPNMHRDRGFGLSPPLQTLHIELVRRGFTAESAANAVREIAVKDAQIGSVNDLREYGLHLFWTAQYRRSLMILKLDAELHPDSALAFETLASAYELNGDDALAEQAHQTAVKLKQARKP